MQVSLWSDGGHPGGHPMTGQADGHPGVSSHAAGPHGHVHTVAPGADRRFLLAALALIVVFMIAEVGVGIASGSLALISAAGHMLTDAASLALAIFAAGLVEQTAGGVVPGRQLPGAGAPA